MCGGKLTSICIFITGRRSFFDNGTNVGLLSLGFFSIVCVVIFLMVLLWLLKRKNATQPIIDEVLPEQPSSIDSEVTQPEQPPAIDSEVTQPEQPPAIVIPPEQPPAEVTQPEQPPEVTQPEQPPPIVTQPETDEKIQPRTIKKPPGEWSRTKEARLKIKDKITKEKLPGAWPRTKEARLRTVEVQHDGPGTEFETEETQQTIEKVLSETKETRLAKTEDSEQSWHGIVKSLSETKEERLRTVEISHDFEPLPRTKGTQHAIEQTPKECTWRATKRKFGSAQSWHGIVESFSETKEKRLRTVEIPHEIEPKAEGNLHRTKRTQHAIEQTPKECTWHGTKRKFGSAQSWHGIVESFSETKEKRLRAVEIPHEIEPIAEGNLPRTKGTEHGSEQTPKECTWRGPKRKFGSAQSWHGIVESFSETKEKRHRAVEIPHEIEPIAEGNLPTTKGTQHAIKQTPKECTWRGTKRKFGSAQSWHGIMESFSETKEKRLRTVEIPHEIEPKAEGNLHRTKGTQHAIEQTPKECTWHGTKRKFGSAQSWHGIVQSFSETKVKRLRTVEIPHEIEPKAEGNLHRTKGTQLAIEETPTEWTPHGTEGEFDSEQSLHGIVETLSETKEKRLRTVEVPYEIDPKAEGSLHGTEETQHVIEETLTEWTPHGTEGDFDSEQSLHGIVETLSETKEKRLRTVEVPYEIEPKAEGSLHGTEETQHVIEETLTEWTPHGTERDFDSEQSLHGIVETLSETKEKRLRTVEVPYEIEPKAERSLHGIEETSHVIEETPTEWTPHGTEGELDSEQSLHKIVGSLSETKEKQLGSVEVPYEIEPKAEGSLHGTEETQHVIEETLTEWTPHGTEGDFDSEQSWHGIVETLSETKEKRLITVEVPYEIEPKAEGNLEETQHVIEEIPTEWTPHGTEGELDSEQSLHRIVGSLSETKEKQLRSVEVPYEIEPKAEGNLEETQHVIEEIPTEWTPHGTEGEFDSEQSLHGIVVSLSENKVKTVEVLHEPKAEGNMYETEETQHAMEETQAVTEGMQTGIDGKFEPEETQHGIEEAEEVPHKIESIAEGAEEAQHVIEETQAGTEGMQPGEFEPEETQHGIQEAKEAPKIEPKTEGNLPGTDQEETQQEENQAETEGTQPGTEGEFKPEETQHEFEEADATPHNIAEGNLQIQHAIEETQAETEGRTKEKFETEKKQHEIEEAEEAPNIEPRAEGNLHGTEETQHAIEETQAETEGRTTGKFQPVEMRVAEEAPNIEPRAEGNLHETEETQHAIEETQAGTEGRTTEKIQPVEMREAEEAPNIEPRAEGNLHGTEETQHAIEETQAGTEGRTKEKFEPEETQHECEEAEEPRTKGNLHGAEETQHAIEETHAGTEGITKETFEPEEMQHEIEEAEEAPNIEPRAKGNQHGAEVLEETQAGTEGTQPGTEEELESEQRRHRIVEAWSETEEPLCEMEPGTDRKLPSMEKTYHEIAIGSEHGIKETLPGAESGTEKACGVELPNADHKFEVAGSIDVHEATYPESEYSFMEHTDNYRVGNDLPGVARKGEHLIIEDIELSTDHERDSQSGTQHTKIKSTLSAQIPTGRTHFSEPGAHLTSTSSDGKVTGSVSDTIH